MGVVLLVVAVVAVNGVAITALLRRRARSLPIASVDGGGSIGALAPPRGQLILLAAALRTLAIRALLVLTCALGAASVVSAVWAVPHASSQPPAQVLALSFGFLPLFLIAVIANTI